jgi:hypothetical protein
MNKEEMAARLTGRSYGEEVTCADEADAKASGLLIVFGASDDLLEFRGAFMDELGAYEGGSFRFHAGGALESWESLEKDDEEAVRHWFADKDKSREIVADWNADGYSWVIRCDVPHATFEILEDGEKFCRGIVLSVADLS